MLPPDLESAFLYIDDQLVWTETFSGLLGTNLCGNGAKETIHPVSVSFPHYAQGVSIMVTTSINQAGTDESWGIANFKITTALEDCAHVLYASDFSSDLVDGWDINNAAINNVTTCGSDVLLGGFGNFGVGAEAIKTVSIPNGGAGVVVAFSFIKIDSFVACSSPAPPQLNATSFCVAWETDQRSVLCVWSLPTMKVGQ